MLKKATFIVLLCIFVTQQIQSDPQKKNLTITEALKKHTQEKEKAKSDLLRAGIAAGSAVALFCITQYIIVNMNPVTFRRIKQERPELNGLRYLDIIGFSFCTTEASLLIYSAIKSVQANKHYFFPNNPAPAKKA